MVCRDRLWFWRAELAPDPAHVVPEEGEAPEVAWGRALDAEALERSTCAHVDLAGGHVAESIFHRRAAPHARAARPACTPRRLTRQPRRLAAKV